LQQPPAGAVGQEHAAFTIERENSLVHPVQHRGQALDLSFQSAQATRQAALHFLNRARERRRRGIAVHVDGRSGAVSAEGFDRCLKFLYTAPGERQNMNANAALETTGSVDRRAMVKRTSANANWSAACAKASFQNSREVPIPTMNHAGDGTAARIVAAMVVSMHRRNRWERSRGVGWNGAKPQAWR
jgi:hypothetical protein